MNPELCEVVSKDGSCVTIREKQTGKTFIRNSAHLKQILQSSGDPVPIPAGPTSSPPLDSVSSIPPEQAPPKPEGIQAAPQRTSSRSVKVPAWMNDFV